MNPIVIPVSVAPTYPLPESLGAPQPGYISALLSNYAYIRKLPSVKGVSIGTVKLGDVVSFRPTTFTNPDDKYTWTWLESHGGWVASVATITAGTPPTVETPTALVDDAVFVSQLGADADLRNNDCLIACAVAWAKLRLKRSGYGDMPLLKVDNMIPLSPLATNDSAMTIAKAQDFITSLGVPYTYSSKMTPDAIVQEIDAKRPPILLVNYRWIKPGGKAFGHYLIAVGYNADGFFLNDPYLTGEKHFINRADLDKALTDLKNDDGTSFASIPYQALAFAA